MNERAKTILNFWFIQSSMDDWFKKDKKYDDKIKKLFLIDLNKAINNDLDEWQDSAEECVALVILLDQFSRNIFRDSPKSYAQDNKTRLIVNEAVDFTYTSLSNVLFFSSCSPIAIAPLLPIPL